MVADDAPVKPADDASVKTDEPPPPADDDDKKRTSSQKEDIRKEETLKHRLLEAKLREEEQKRKAIERQYRRKLITKQRRVQDELEYINFPTLTGFYFDGFHEHHFLLKKEWADIFNETEEIKARQQMLDHHETFEEMVKRNFWPPRLFGNMAFRTRGIYLDSKEVMMDPPRTPPEIDHRVDGVSVAGTLRSQRSLASQLLGPTTSTVSLGGKSMAGRSGYSSRHRFGVSGKGIVEGGGSLNKNDFYFDEDVGNWFLRRNKDPDAVYYDTKYGIWRLKRRILKYNGDWWFNADKGAFELKDRAKARVYRFDNDWNVWLMRGNKGPNSAGLLPKDFYYNEFHGQWKLRSSTKSDLVKFDENGWRFSQRVNCNSPDDFYFDETGLGIFVLKEPGEGKSYAYDEYLGCWRKVGAENMHCQLKPSDYYWSDVENEFRAKTGTRTMYEFDACNHFYRKKKLLQGKHHPSTWKWDGTKKCWVYKKAQRGATFTDGGLNWRPPRDYDKPWQDFEGYNYNFIYPETAGGEPNEQIAREQQQLMEHGVEIPGGAGGKPEPGKASGAEWGDEDYKNNPNRIPFNAPANNLIDLTSEKKEGAGGGVEGEAELGFVDRAIDRKRLKCGNLGGMVTEQELKAFFFAAIDVVKPLNRDPKDHDDYMYIQFPNDEAATAAFKTMNKMDIKGQRIVLSYPRRHQR